MTSIDLEVSSFKDEFNHLNGKKQLKVSGLKFIKYAMNAGMPLFDGPGISSQDAFALALYKAIGVTCALDFSGAQIRSKYSPNLDPTEKMSLSTWVGMTGAAFVADEILGVSSLYHAEALRKNGKLKVINPNSRRLADLIGRDHMGRWHVVEAKARQTKPTKKNRLDWKSQAQTIGTIEGQPPETNSYCYTRINDPCKIELCDPPAEENGVHLELTEGEFGLVDTYYHVLMDVLRDVDDIYLDTLRNTHEISINIGESRIRFTLAGFDPTVKKYIHVGLDSEVYEKVHRIHDRLTDLREQGELHKEILDECMWNYKLPKIEPIDEDGIYMGSDGVVVVASKYPRM